MECRCDLATHRHRPSREALDEARELKQGGHLTTAANRTYFAAFYASLALVSSIGLEPKSHDGVRHLVNLHFVKAGKLPPETSRVLAQLEGLRNDADYDLAAVFTEAGVDESLADATRFVDAVSALLGA